MSMIMNMIAPVAKILLKGLGKRALPQVEGGVVLPGLSSQVEIIRDQWGIPHIYAETFRDAYFAQGYVHAQDRLFQMELNRRTARGKLSELFGSMSLETDRTARTFGFERLGRQDLMKCSQDVR